MSFLNQWIRVFLDDNGTLADYSITAQDDNLINLPFVAAEDALYIAQDMPFNNFFVEVETQNTELQTVAIETWSGSAWESVANIIDGTQNPSVTPGTISASLFQDGVIQFIPSRDQTWDFVHDTTETVGALGLSGVEIYDKFWLRIKWSGDLSAGTQIKKIGYAFCNDRQLTAIDPEIDNYLTSWSATKTDWVEQILLASEAVAADFKRRGLIVHPGQVLRLEDLSLATAYKTLEIIYNKLGPGFEFQRENAMKQYDALSRGKRFSFDQGADGRLDRGEFQNSVVRARR